jgi:hypothetical protein
VFVVVEGFASNLQKPREVQNNLKFIYASVNHDALLYANKTCQYLKRLSQVQWAFT